MGEEERGIEGKLQKKRKRTPISGDSFGLFPLLFVFSFFLTSISSEDFEDTKNKPLSSSVPTPTKERRKRSRLERIGEKEDKEVCFRGFLCCWLGFFSPSARRWVMTNSHSRTKMRKGALRKRTKERRRWRKLTRFVFFPLFLVVLVVLVGWLFGSLVGWLCWLVGWLVFFSSVLFLGRRH